MEKKKIYDFHTHIDELNTIEKYYESNIVPVINCQNEDEYYEFKEYFEKIKGKLEYANEEFYFSIGIHPNDSLKYKKDVNDVYKDIVLNSPIIGEIGMDGCWCDVSFDVQEEVFRKSLDIAKKYSKPVILHTKFMEKKIFDIIKDYELDFIVHWYSCDNYIDEFIEKSCYFTIGPALLVDENVRMLVKRAPIDRLLLETDGLEALEWLFKKKYRADDLRSVLETVCEEISLLKNIDIDRTYSVLQKNSEKLLKIK
ncbi:TatD family deoxyribonuclease [Peptostreptococcus russellii]|uniref:TatD family hydrolase n=1 Tax=Peptostreptococcus russellii TaxID=215200 RepID=UPI0016279307|nr:TatD family hydrolase [Peptostreptococcus russellii]MBC2577806.1 TatD family deoxyribonuclease [Peptostreptococcus russellii]